MRGSFSVYTVLLGVLVVAALLSIVAMFAVACTFTFGLTV